MDLGFSPADIAFREEVRGFIAANLPAALREKVRAGARLDKADFVAWQKILHAHGWAAPAWPREHGGTGWTLTQRYLFEEEAAAADAPPQAHYGLSLIGPVLYTFGSAAQKARWLPGILSGDVWWCQGYSERQAGSDLAALQTKAVRDGDHFVVSGHKIWTTFAHWADMMFALVRTGGGTKRQEGISMLLIPMDSLGLTLRSVVTIDHAHHVNEIFFDEVRVPAANLVGEEGRGWTYGKFLLDRERGVSATHRRLKRGVQRLHELAREAPGDDGRPLAEDPVFADKLAQLEIEVLALEMMTLCVLAEISKGEEPGARSSVLKLRASELLQRITEMAVKASGYDAAPFVPLGNASLPEGAPHRMRDYLHFRAATIYGGSSEIQRTLIARRILGL
jgi:alkylation response protein AidB-like acyl-CoA dehydrogenase